MPDLFPEQSTTELPARGLSELSQQQRAALAAVVAATEEGHGFAAVIGEPGTGKTTVLDVAASLLGHPPVRVIRCAGEDDVLRLQLLLAFVVVSDHFDEECPEPTVEQPSPSPRPFARTLLLIDDAHRLREDALACLLGASEMPPGHGLGMQIVFAGLPSFWSLLEAPALRPLRQRIAFQAMLGPSVVPAEEAPPAAPTPLRVPATLRLRAMRYRIRLRRGRGGICGGVPGRWRRPPRADAGDRRAKRCATGGKHIGH